MTNEQEVRSVLAPLQKLAAEQSVAIVGIMHLNKKADLSAINRVGGAMAFVGVARAVWLFCADEQNRDQYKMLPLKKNIGKRLNGLLYRITTSDVQIGGQAVSQPCIEWTGQSDESVDAVLASRPVGRPRDERDRASAWLKEILTSGPMLSTDIKNQAEATGIAYRTLQRITTDRDSGVRVFKQADGWYWKLAGGLDIPDVKPNKGY